MKDIRSIITQMTLEEKAALCTGASPWTTTPVERLGIPEMTVSDGPHGVRRVSDIAFPGGGQFTRHLLPHRLLPGFHLGCELDLRNGAALAEECIALNVDVVLGPGRI